MNVDLVLEEALASVHTYEARTIETLGKESGYRLLWKIEKQVTEAHRDHRYGTEKARELAFRREYARRVDKVLKAMKRG